MTEDAGSHGHRSHARRSGGSGTGRWAMMGGWSVAAVLAAYLVWGVLNRADDGQPRAPFSEKALYTALFWTPVALAGAASAAGILWTTRAYARREKPSLLWMRRAFVFGVVAAVLLAVVPRDRDKGYWFVAWIAASIVAAQSGLFAYAAFRESRRSSGGHRSHRDGDIGDGDEEAS